MKKLGSYIALAALSGIHLSAAADVWRYTDANGHTIYSNVPIKGKKGEKLEVLVYPPAVQPAGAAAGASSPLPPEILRQIQQQKREALPVPPDGLPPLPPMPKQGEPVSASPKKRDTVTEPGWAKSKETTSEAPSWAREPSEGGRPPGWAQDPFKSN